MKPDWTARDGSAHRLTGENRTSVIAWQYPATPAELSLPRRFGSVQDMAVSDSLVMPADLDICAREPIHIHGRRAGP